MLLALFIILTACQDEGRDAVAAEIKTEQKKENIENLNNNKENTIHSSDKLNKKSELIAVADTVQEYKLINQYKAILIEIFETNKLQDSVLELEKSNNNFMTQMEKNCTSEDRECIEKFSKNYLKEILENYFDIEELFVGNLVPVNINQNICYANKAVINIDPVKNKLFFIDNCGPDKITFSIAIWDKPKKITPESFLISIGGSVENDDEVDQYFTLMPGGVKKWIVITNGRSAYGYGKAGNAPEIPLASVYEIDK